MSYIENDSLGVAHKELPPQFHLSAWLGAYFQIKGAFTYVVHKPTLHSKQPYATPGIKISDDDPIRLELFQKTVGLEKLKTTSNGVRSPNSRLIQIYAANAIELVDLMKSFALSRKPQVLSFLDWNAADTRQKKLLIGKSYLKNGGVQRMQIPVQVYQHNLDDPSFLAGVVDAGLVVSQDGLGIQTGNLPLLEALHRRFLGGEPKPQKNGGYRWRIYERGDILNLLHTVQSYLQILDPSVV